MISHSGLLFLGHPVYALSLWAANKPSSIIFVSGSCVCCIHTRTYLKYGYLRSFTPYTFNETLRTARWPSGICIATSHVRTYGGISCMVRLVIQSVCIVVVGKKTNSKRTWRWQHRMELILLCVSVHSCCKAKFSFLVGLLVLGLVIHR